MEISTQKNIVYQKKACTEDAFCHRSEILPAVTEKKAEGGLRMAGKYKVSQPGKPLVTFITVVWNNEKTLLRCMESVWKQSYDNIEYIVLDGGSTDGTLRYIEENADKIDYYASQKDKGIYDAMNKAIALASGDIISLINSDDWAAEGAAEEAARLFELEHYDLLGGTGNVYQPDESLAFVWKPREINCGTIFFGVPMLHQAVYISAACYNKVGGLDENCAIAADYKQMLKIYFSGCKICRTDKILAHFMLGGASADKEVDLKERIGLIREYFPFLEEAEALQLHRALDVTLFWAELGTFDDKAALRPILEKYAAEPLLLRAIAEALMARYEELKPLYLQKAAVPAYIEQPKSLLKKCAEFFK